MQVYIPEIAKSIDVPEDLDRNIIWPPDLDALPDTPLSVWKILDARQAERNARWAESRRRLDVEPESDPAEWPAWVDEYRWELDEPPGDDEPAFEPSPDDRAFFAPLDLADEAEAWDGYREWVEAVEGDAIARMVPGCSHESALI